MANEIDDGEPAPSQTVSLNGRMVDLSGVALEVMRAMDAERYSATKASFDRGYIGGRTFDVPTLRRVKFLISQAAPHPSLVEATAQIDRALALTDALAARKSKGDQHG